MIECSYLNTKDLLNVPNTVSFDPGEDSKLSSNITKIMKPGSGEIAVTIAYLVLKGYAGSGTVRLSGYDYHNGTASLGAQKDFEAGQALGMMLQMAANLQRKLMIHIYTDGGVDPVNKAENVDGTEKFKWSGDSEMRSAAFVLVYDPSSRPEINVSGTKRQQLGAYKSDDGGTINLSPSLHAAISSSPRAQAQVVVANWLAWQGQEQKIFTAMSDAPISASELDDYLFMSNS